MIHTRLLALSVLLTRPGVGVLLAQETLQARGARKMRLQEEAQDYFRQWLEQDVFRKLRTTEEREQFIEQFWYRRDGDPLTASNEFKEEHYRRLAYANERFQSGVPGWKTDRGRIYIIHGEPAEIEKHQPGEHYQRPSHEGGGFTGVYGFEIWRYRHIEGIGPDVEIEFVDPSGSGEYRLATTPWEKDAFLFVDGAGMTIGEQVGLSSRADPPYFSPWNWDRYPGLHTRAKDNDVYPIRNSGPGSARSGDQVQGSAATR